jgi:hypothetical protein
MFVHSGIRYSRARYLWHVGPTNRSLSKSPSLIGVPLPLPQKMSNRSSDICRFSHSKCSMTSHQVVFPIQTVVYYLSFSNFGRNRSKSPKYLTVSAIIRVRRLSSNAVGGKLRTNNNARSRTETIPTKGGKEQRGGRKPIKQESDVGTFELCAMIKLHSECASGLQQTAEWSPDKLELSSHSDH